jgi:hypothetical protein
VPKLGIQERLNFEVRNETGVKQAGVLIFGTEDHKTLTVSKPDTSVVFFVEGYAPTYLPAPPGP